MHRFTDEALLAEIQRRMKIKRNAEASQPKRAAKKKRAEVTVTLTPPGVPTTIAGFMRFLSEKVVSNEADDATDAMEIVAAKSHVMVSDASTKEEKIEAMAVIMQKYNALLSHAAKFIVDFFDNHVVRGLWARPIWADAAVSGAPCPTSLETAHSDLTRARTNVEKTLLRFARWFSPFLSHLEEGGEAPSLDELKARVPILAPLQGCEPPSSQPPYEGFERLAGSISPFLGVALASAEEALAQTSSVNGAFARISVERIADSITCTSSRGNPMCSMGRVVEVSSQGLDVVLLKTFQDKYTAGTLSSSGTSWSSTLRKIVSEIYKMIDSIVTKEPDAKVRRMMFPALPRNATLRLDESALGDHIVMIEEKPVAAADRPEKAKAAIASAPSSAGIVFEHSDSSSSDEEE